MDVPLVAADRSFQAWIQRMNEIEGTELVEGQAPGIDGVENLETKLDETEQVDRPPEGEFRENRDVQPGEIDQKPGAMRSPPANYDADEAHNNEEA